MTYTYPLGCLLSGYTIANILVVTTCIVFDDPAVRCRRDVGYGLSVAWSSEGDYVTNVRDVQTQSGRHLRVCPNLFKSRLSVH